MRGDARGVRRWIPLRSARVIPRGREIERRTVHFRFMGKTAASFAGRDRGGTRPRDASDGPFPVVVARWTERISDAPVEVEVEVHRGPPGELRASWALESGYAWIPRIVGRRVAIGGHTRPHHGAPCIDPGRLDGDTVLPLGVFFRSRGQPTKTRQQTKTSRVISPSVRPNIRIFPVAEQEGFHRRRHPPPCTRCCRCCS